MAKLPGLDTCFYILYFFNIDASPHSDARFSIELGLMWEAHTHNWNSGSHRGELSALPLSYPAIPNEGWRITYIAPFVVKIVG